MKKLKKKLKDAKSEKLLANAEITAEDVTLAECIELYQKPAYQQEQWINSGMVTACAGYKTQALAAAQLTTAEQCEVFEKKTRLIKLMFYSKAFKKTCAILNQQPSPPPPPAPPPQPPPPPPSPPPPSPPSPPPPPPSPPPPEPPVACAGLCCGGCVSLKCTAGAPSWNSLSSAVFASTKWGLPIIEILLKTSFNTLLCFERIIN